MKSCLIIKGTFRKQSNSCAWACVFTLIAWHVFHCPHVFTWGNVVWNTLCVLQNYYVKFENTRKWRLRSCLYIFHIVQHMKTFMQTFGRLRWRKLSDICASFASLPGWVDFRLPRKTACKLEIQRRNTPSSIWNGTVLTANEWMYYSW